MQRREFLKYFASAAVAACGLDVLAQTRAAGKRPNILFVIADDATWLHFSAYGCKFVSTPNFDRVAREGILFNNCFTTNPKCSPSRATVLTGKNTWQLEDACDHHGLFPNKFKVYPDLLEAAGYHVGFTNQGWKPGDFLASGWKRNPAGRAYNKRWRTAPRPTTRMSNHDYAANFKDFLAERPEGAPFCFWMGSGEPHRAYEKGSGVKAGKKLSDVTVPPYLPDDEVVRSDLLDYALEIEYFDAQLGEMLEVLRQSGEMENTLIVATSDNGMPFPRVKGQIYEDDVHMPLAIRWGEVTSGGRVVDDFISFSDMAPTFMEVAGLTPLAEMSGRSFLPVLKSAKSGQIDPTRDRIIVGKERHDVGRPGNVGYPVRAIRTRQWLYVRNFEPERWPACDPPGYRNIDPSPTKDLLIAQHAAGEDKYWALAMGKRPAEELFDMTHDTDCLNNLAEKPEYAQIKQALWEDMRQKLIAEKDPRILGQGAVFDTYPRGVRPENVGRQTPDDPIRPPKR